MEILTLNLKRNRDSQNPLAQKIDDNTYFKYFYLPHIISDVFYDYVDTVMNISVQMRISEVKKVTRSIRELKGDYDYLRKRCFNFNNQQTAVRHMDYFNDVYAEELENEYKLIKWRVSNLRKKLLPEWQTFIASVYMSICIYKALKEFCVEADNAISRLWGKASHSIMLDMIPATFELLKEYLGDCDVLSESDIKASGSRILDMIRSIQFTTDEAEAGDMKKTLYQRYMELKGNSAKAPSGTTKLLMKEFNITSEKEYYRMIRKASMAV